LIVIIADVPIHDYKVIKLQQQKVTSMCIIFFCLSAPLFSETDMLIIL